MPAPESSLTTNNGRGGPHPSKPIDEVAILRAMDGDKTVRLTKSDRIELVRRWIASGRSMAECARVTGLKPERYTRLIDLAEEAS